VFETHIGLIIIHNTIYMYVLTSVHSTHHQMRRCILQYIRSKSNLTKTSYTVHTSPPHRYASELCLWLHCHSVTMSHCSTGDIMSVCSDINNARPRTNYSWAEVSEFKTRRYCQCYIYLDYRLYVCSVFP